LKGVLDQIHEKFYGDAKKNQKPVESEVQTLSRKMTLIDPMVPDDAIEEKKWRLHKDLPEIEGAVLCGTHVGNNIPLIETLFCLLCPFSLPCSRFLLFFSGTRYLLGTTDSLLYWNGKKLFSH